MGAASNRKSLQYGVPGICLQLAGLVGTMAVRNTDRFVLALVLLTVMNVGSVLLILALSHYAAGKGYSRWLGLLGFATVIGVIALAALPDRNEAGARF